MATTSARPLRFLLLSLHTFWRGDHSLQSILYLAMCTSLHYHPVPGGAFHQSTISVTTARCNNHMRHTGHYKSKNEQKIGFEFICVCLVTTLPIRTIISTRGHLSHLPAQQVYPELYLQKFSGGMKCLSHQ